MYALIHPLHVSSHMIASFMYVRCVQVCLHQEYIALVNQQQHLVNTLTIGKCNCLTSLIVLSLFDLSSNM